MLEVARAVQERQAGYVDCDATKVLERREHPCDMLECLIGREFLHRRLILAIVDELHVQRAIYRVLHQLQVRADDSNQVAVSLVDLHKFVDPTRRAAVVPRLHRVKHLFELVHTSLNRL